MEKKKNILNRWRNFFIGRALSKTDDPFDNVRVEVLLNFALFFFITNIPYLFVSYSSFAGHFISAIVHNCVMLVVIILLKKGMHLKFAIRLFLINSLLQNLYHFLLNNGTQLGLGILFYLMMSLMSFILIGRKWGTAFTIATIIMIITGIYNVNSDFSLFHFPPELGDPPITGNLAYMIVLPFLLNTYLVSEFVKAQKKAQYQLKEQKNLVIQKNHDITQSINYAKRIQDAKLPRLQEISTALPHSFILNKPKDIVSGDFYSFQEKDEYIFIAAADCTGHGVPGAFMSIIGTEKLGEAISLYDETSEILSYVNRSIKNSLKQTGDDSTRDGMDIAICRINKKDQTLQYSGANRPLWILRKDANEIEEIKATKKAIGGFTEMDQKFESQFIQFKSGDSFYIFSDGYADTFGGRSNKKLTTKKFKQLLIEARNIPMKDQERYFDEFIEKWKSGSEQVDDILVMGFKL